MSQELKQHFYNWIRPFHSPITRALRQRLARNYESHPEMELPPPYEAVQLDVERHLHDYLHVCSDAISQIVIVGCSSAPEIERLNAAYPNAHILGFEPNPDSLQYLNRKYGKASRISFSGLALSDEPGRARFFEPVGMSGNGSLLEPDMESWATAVKSNDKRMTSFDVELSTLDHETATLPAIDLLWMDVQGAEGKVLAGAKETLKRIKAVFLEVALFHSPYKEAQLFPQVKATLESLEFVCVGLGLDARTGTGNAFFVKNFETLIYK
jgi:2-O-methyltransferase